MNDQTYYVVTCANCNTKYAFKEHYEAEQDCIKCGGLLGVFFINSSGGDLIQLPEGVTIDPHFKDRGGE